jgi:hypothetical protein
MILQERPLGVGKARPMFFRAECLGWFSGLRPVVCGLWVWELWCFMGFSWVGSVCSGCFGFSYARFSWVPVLYYLCT